MEFTGEEKQALQLFNDKANVILSSDFKDKSKNKGVGETLSWNLNETTNNLDFNYSVTNHDPNYVSFVLLPLRLFLQNEPISIKNIAKIYENEIIEISYRDIFNQLRKTINDYFNEPAKTLLDGKPTREVLFRTIINGEVFHLSKNEQSQLEKWKSDKTTWDLAYVEYQRIIHDYIDGIEGIKNLNEEVLEKYG